MTINSLVSRTLSYSSFTTELNELLRKSGIVSSRQFIRGQSDDTTDWPSSLTENASPQLGRVIIYVEKHLTEQLSLDKMAEEAQLSKYQLIRHFQNAQDITPWKYVVSRRIEKAKELLREGRSPGQVAVETGFYDQAHFSKSFKEETGQTPKEYQEEHV